MSKYFCACLFLWVLGGAAVAEDTPAAPAKASQGAAYMVQPGDVLFVSVWKEPDMQLEVLVRPDGGFSFPLIGDINATGKSMPELQSLVTRRLKVFIPDPVVTVGLKEIVGNKIYVIGKVTRPGEYLMSRQLDVMQALSVAGGLTPFAAGNDIKVLRRAGGYESVLPFRYADVERGRNLEQNILLKSGDVIVVP